MLSDIYSKLRASQWNTNALLMDFNIRNPTKAVFPKWHASFFISCCFVIFFLSNVDFDATAVQSELYQVYLGIYTINVEGGGITSPPADVGLWLRGWNSAWLGKHRFRHCMLAGVIYALNTSYLQKLRAFFEVLQKLFLQLDAGKLSAKVQMLKNKLWISPLLIVFWRIDNFFGGVKKLSKIQKDQGNGGLRERPVQP